MYLPVHHHSHCHTANNKRQHINIHVHAAEDCIMGRVINEVCVSVNCTQFSVAFSLSRITKICQEASSIIPDSN